MNSPAPTEKDAKATAASGSLGRWIALGLLVSALACFGLVAIAVAGEEPATADPPFTGARP